MYVDASQSALIIDNPRFPVGPIFQRYMFSLAAQADNAKEPVPIDLAHSVHNAMAESMLILIIGEVCCYPS
jgi:hypothetical protein